MELKEIEHHWQKWASEYNIDLRATTKTSTIKSLEINALHQAILKTPFAPAVDCDILEVGCGNAYNCFGLAGLLPNARFTGIDFIPDMVQNANTLREAAEYKERLQFYTGDILKLQDQKAIHSQYDIVFTDRCIINLNSLELQTQALDQLTAKTKPGGFIILIENIKQSYDNQNKLRELLGLESRTPDKFNLFIDETAFLSHASQSLNLVMTENFGALHDLLLYVLIPSFNEGKTDYDHPAVTAITNLLLQNNEALSATMGPIGQNKLYLFQKNT